MTEKLGTALQIGAAAMAAAAAAIVLPNVLDLGIIVSAPNFIGLAILALSLGLVWGFGGILCFGQTTFFGLGGYAYAIAALNFEDSTWAVPIALAVPTLAAAALGYLMFYGRISDVYMGVITLTATLILAKFVGSTAGDQWRIGKAPLGGFNGIPAVPPLNVPGAPDQPLDPTQIFVVAVVCLFVCYAIAKLLLRTRFGRVAVAIRENEARAELLGYDVRLYKLGIFTVGGAMAGLAGIIFAIGVMIVTPTMFSLGYAGQAIIWVLIGGLGTLVGPVIGCLLVQAAIAAAGAIPPIDPEVLTRAAAAVANVPVVGGPLSRSLPAIIDALTHPDPNLLLGILFMLAVLVIPKGLLPTASGLGGRLLRRHAA